MLLLSSGGGSIPMSASDEIVDNEHRKLEV